MPHTSAKRRGGTERPGTGPELPEDELLGPTMFGPVVRRIQISWHHKHFILGVGG